MKDILGLELKNGSREELLPDFAPDFPYIATRARLDSYAEPFVPWHWHRSVELFYIESGSLEYTTPNGKWLFPAGSGGMVNANVLHATRAPRSGEPNIQLLHIFEPSLISGERGSRMEQRYVAPLVSESGLELIALAPECPEQAEILGHIRQAFELRDDEWGYEFRLREALTRIWMELFAHARPAMGRGRGEGRTNAQVKQMMAYVHEHYGSRISVDELAASAYVSRRGCFRAFRETLHMSPVEYIRDYRLRQACRLLAEGNEPVTEIASRCGLGSASYFGKLFREKFGCTPMEYRTHWRNNDIFGQK